jgi:hypothetical protein
VPLDASPESAATLRAQGWATVGALEAAADPFAAARLAGCTHLLDGIAPVALQPE